MRFGPRRSGRTTGLQCVLMVVGMARRSNFSTAARLAGSGLGWQDAVAVRWERNAVPRKVAWGFPRETVARIVHFGSSCPDSSGPDDTEPLPAA